MGEYEVLGVGRTERGREERGAWRTAASSPRSSAAHAATNVQGRTGPAADSRRGKAGVKDGITTVVWVSTPSALRGSSLVQARGIWGHWRPFVTGPPCHRGPKRGSSFSQTDQPALGPLAASVRAGLLKAQKSRPASPCRPACSPSCPQPMALAVLAKWPEQDGSSPPSRCAVTGSGAAWQSGLRA